MPTHVYANNNEIASKAADGKSIAAFPDVCFSPPAPPVGPIPLPYPNTGEVKDTDSGTAKVFIKDKMSGMAGDSYMTKSMGDEPATQNFNKGFKTNALQGKCYFKLWSMDVQMECKGVPRHLDMVSHNHASECGETFGVQTDGFNLTNDTNNNNIHHSKKSQNKRILLVKSVELAEQKKIVPCSTIKIKIKEFNYKDPSDIEIQNIKWKLVINDIVDGTPITTIEKHLNFNGKLECILKICYFTNIDRKYTLYPYIVKPNDEVTINFTVKSMSSIRSEIIEEAQITERSLYCTNLDIKPEIDCDYKCIVIHHAGDSYTTDSLPQQLYKEKLGGIPYHYIIHHTGTIYEGRSILYKGSHTQSANSKRIGICFLGDYAPNSESRLFDFDSNDMTPNSKNIAAAQKLISVLMKKFNITHLCGHRELAKLVGVNETVCPGANLMPYVENFRKIFSLKAPETKEDTDLRENGTTTCY